VIDVREGEPIRLTVGNGPLDVRAGQKVALVFRDDRNWGDNQDGEMVASFSIEGHPAASTQRSDAA
jgi:hypothetical protein